MHLVEKTHPALHQVAANVTDFGKETQRTIERMAAILKRSKGVGLAAPQVGLSIRLFLVSLGNNPEETPYLRINGKTMSPAQVRPLAIFNPEVDLQGDIVRANEGCLSLPEDGRISIPRATEVIVEAQDANGRPLRIETAGLFARVIQHENDHLHGILITDPRHQVELQTA